MAKKKQDEIENEIDLDDDGIEVTVFELPDSLKEKRTVYPTLYRNIDTNIGFNTYNEKTAELIRTNRGLLSGSTLALTGVSGAGKSTLANQILANMMRPFIMKKDERVKLYIFDTENGVSRERWKNITNFVDEEIDRHVIFMGDISIDSLNEVTGEIIKGKKDMKKDKVVNYYGQEVEIYPPTFILVDAISEMVPREFAKEGSEDSNMMSATSARKMMSYMQRYKPHYVNYNINMVAIAHFADKINFSGNMATANPVREWKAIANNKKINGGKPLQYATDVGIVLDRIIHPNKASLEKNNLSYLDANDTLSCALYKNRQGVEGTPIYLVRDGSGFNPVKSFVFECAQYDVIKSVGAYKSVEGYESKFRGAEIMNLFREEPTFRKCLFTGYDNVKKYVFEANKKSDEDRRKILDELSLLFED